MEYEKTNYKRLRKACGLRQEDIAKILGVSRATYITMEKQGRLVTPDHYYILHENFPAIFKLPRNFFCYGTDVIKDKCKLYKIPMNVLAESIGISVHMLNYRIQKVKFWYDDREKIQLLFAPYAVSIGKLKSQQEKGKENEK